LPDENRVIGKGVRMYFIKYDEDYRQVMIQMIMNFFNEHRDMTRSRPEFYIDHQEAGESLEHWLAQSDLYLTMDQDQVIGFLRLRFGGDRAAWLEDLYVRKDQRGKGYGSQSMTLIDDLMTQENVLAMFVDVIPSNPAAIRLYVKYGFDHLNMIQLRKNYDKTLNKKDQVSLLGFDLYKY